MSTGRGHRCNGGLFRLNFLDQLRWPKKQSLNYATTVQVMPPVFTAAQRAVQTPLAHVPTLVRTARPTARITPNNAVYSINETPLLSSCNSRRIVTNIFIAKLLRTNAFTKSKPSLALAQRTPDQLRYAFPKSSTESKP